jgi:hypothetical protein
MIVIGYHGHGSVEITSRGMEKAKMRSSRRDPRIKLVGRVDSWCSCMRLFV